MAVVLIVSSDDHLSMTRRLILEKAGHRVVSAMTLEQVKSACRENRIEVVVIGQGVERTERIRVYDAVRAAPRHSKILELYRPYEGRSLPQADSWLEVPTDAPPLLAERVGELAKQSN